MASVTAEPSSRPLSIEIVSDFACPWCLIGTRRLEIALASLPDVAASWTYRPFLLDPSTPAEGVDLRDRLRRKYGDPEPLFRRVETAAKESGIALDFDKVRRGVPTLRAHTLSRLAIDKGTQRALARDLFDAYFLEGRDISAMDVLLELAQRHGFSRDETLEALESPSELDQTREEARAAAEAGITGVPFVVIDQRFAVPGAQAPEMFRRAIERARG
ncbi:MAG: DsbA family oxidoreductase [Myxococcales bacterium]|nr:DsbA family oxidoreductase [Myxococcales bacterium]